MSKKLTLGLALAILAVVAFIYLPVIHGEFLWDDWPSLRDLQGDQWLHYVFRDFNRWTYYFRPLPVAFFSLQIKAFHSDPGPMHAVSLALHLVNVALIGLLSLRIGKLAGANDRRKQITALICMLIYGLHPALIEPVVWVGLQTDLIVTMLTLAGLLATLSIDKPSKRAAALGALFFFAACTKEAASVFPLLIALFDWALFARDERNITGAIRSILHRNWRAYAAMLATGLAYLSLRHWALGKVDYPTTSSLRTPLAQFQEVCFIYLAYLKVILWPIAGMGPLHPVDVTPFRSFSPSTSLTDFVAVGLVLGSLYLAVRRAWSLAFIVLAVTIALLPVIRILPVSFERSLYHERYAMIAVAMVCALLPLLKWPHPSGGTAAGVTRPLAPIAIFLWLAFSIIDIHVIVPKWQSDTTLWEWALDTNPNSSQAKDNLLLTYAQTGNFPAAQKLADRLLAEPEVCTSCMLHLTNIALEQNDVSRAAAALDRARGTLLFRRDPETRQLYYRQLGRLLVMQGRYDDATQALQAALTLLPSDAQAKSDLAKANKALKTKPKP